MPRRRPGRVRVELLRSRAHRLVVDGLSARTLAEIERIEYRRNDLWPGVTREALRRWREFVRDPHHRSWTERPDTCGVWECCGDPFLAREYLSAVDTSLSRRAKDFRALLRGLDDLY